MAAAKANPAIIVAEHGNAVVGPQAEMSILAIAAAIRRGNSQGKPVAWSDSALHHHA